MAALSLGVRRQPSTQRDGSGFSEQVKLAVWNKGALPANNQTSNIRFDRYGALMRFASYGLRTSGLGWEIDHINPVANGGTDDLSNLQPLYWSNNASKGDNASPLIPSKWNSTNQRNQETL